MLIARVTGDVTATIKHPSHEGKKILLVQPLDLDGSDRGNPIVVVDSVGAGTGDRVLVALAFLSDPGASADDRRRAIEALEQLAAEKAKRLAT